MRRKLADAPGGKLGEIISSGRAPGAIVRGERLNKEIPTEHRHGVHSIAYQGRNCAQVEEAHERVWKKKARMAQGQAKGAPIRHIGSTPFEEYAATRRMIGDHTGKELIKELGQRGRLWDKPRDEA